MKLLTSLFCLFALLLSLSNGQATAQTVVRYNQLGYTPNDIKVVVAGSKNAGFRLAHYQLKNIKTGQAVLTVRAATEKDYGSYGPFQHSFRINLSSVTQPGEYLLMINDTIRSGIIRIGHDVYKGTSDFCLQFLREQRCGFNPLTQDTCHLNGDYTVGGPLPLGTSINVQGGWHNAANEVQEISTAATVTWYLLSAYQQFPSLFNDGFDINGNRGRNGKPDVLDEAKWGLDWLIRMHPSKNQLYDRAGDWPGLKNAQGVNGRVHGRPVYFIASDVENTVGSNDPVGRVTCLLSSTFSLGSLVAEKTDAKYAARLNERAANTYQWPNSTGNMALSSHINFPEKALAAAGLYQLSGDKKYLADFNSALKAKTLTHTWADTSAKNQLTNINYAGYHNMASVESYCADYRSSIEKVWQTAKSNAFLRGLPFVQGSNNLTVSFVLQCLKLRASCNSSGFAELEQANIDWLFGCNPWGINMIAGYPSGNAPINPSAIHAFLGLKGGLVNGPVSLLRYKNDNGNSLLKKDRNADWQSSLAVYHDDTADYSTNEPTIDGTAALIYLLASKESEALRNAPNGFEVKNGAVRRGDSSQKKIALVFTGNQYGSGAKAIPQILAKEKLHASFFLATAFIKKYGSIARQIKTGGHYIGANVTAAAADCDQPGCDPYYQSGEMFSTALLDNYQALKPFGITIHKAPVFLPANENYSKEILAVASEQHLKLINPTPGTLSRKDQSIPGLPGYYSSDSIFQNIMAKARQMPYGLNGYFLVFHTDADPARTDKFYLLLPLLLQDLKNEGYQFVRVDEMLGLKVPAPDKGTRKKVATKKKRHKM